MREIVHSGGTRVVKTTSDGSPAVAIGLRRGETSHGVIGEFRVEF